MQRTQFEFRGDGLTYLLYFFGSYIFSILTLYLATPWLYCWRIHWITANTYINNRRLIFTGSGIQVFGLFLQIFFGAIFTLGLYIPFGVVQIEKWKLRNTFFEDEFYSNDTKRQIDLRNNYETQGDHLLNTAAIDLICCSCHQVNNILKDELNDNFFDCLNCKTVNYFSHEYLNVSSLRGYRSLSDIQKDYICKNCSEALTLDEDEIIQGRFICPICNLDNQLSGRKFINVNDQLQLSIAEKKKIELNNNDEEDFVCINCKSLITLEGTELYKETYTCPVCNNINRIQKL